MEETGSISRLYGGIVFTVSFALTAVILLALLTYSPSDPGFSHVSTSGEIKNVLGTEGAWIADFFYLIFGWGSWVLAAGAVFFLVRGWKRLWGYPAKNTAIPFGLRIFAFVLLILTTTSFFFLRMHSGAADLPATSGGLVGSTLGTLVLSSAGFMAGSLILFAASAILASVFFGFSWLKFCEMLGRGLAGFVSFFKHLKEDRLAKAIGEIEKKRRQSEIKNNETGENHMDAFKVKENDGQKPVTLPLPPNVIRPSVTSTQAQTTTTNGSIAGSPDGSAAKSPVQVVPPPTPSNTIVGSSEKAPTFVQLEPPAPQPQGLFFQNVEENREPKLALDTPVIANTSDKMPYLVQRTNLPVASNTEVNQPPKVQNQTAVNSNGSAWNGIQQPSGDRALPPGLNVFNPAPIQDQNSYSDQTSGQSGQNLATPAPTSTGNTWVPSNQGEPSPWSISQTDHYDATVGDSRNTNQWMNAQDTIQPVANNWGQPIPASINDRQPEPIQPAVMPVEQVSNPPVPPAPVAAPSPYAGYQKPSCDLLDEPYEDDPQVSTEELQFTSGRIEQILNAFKIKARVASAVPGPIVTQFRVHPGEGTRGSKLVGISRDIARGLGLKSLRVVENIGEINCIALEVPNPVPQCIFLSEIIDSYAFSSSPSKLTLALGKNISGDPVVTDLKVAPHLLVAGSTGSGKSVGINAMILSMLYKCTPDELKLVLIDPKEVEFAPYEDIPHLLTPVISDMTKAAHALEWCVNEMERRYSLMRSVGTKNIDAFHDKIRECESRGTYLPNPSAPADSPEAVQRLPYIVVIIDELADLLLQFGKKVEMPIQRLTQKARAAGIHLILATQRPSNDILSAVIKTNCPTRISFMVANRYDSTTILGEAGAEDLLGRGDMFLMRSGRPLTRVHGANVTDEEIRNVTDYLRTQGEPNYVEGVTEVIEEEDDDQFLLPEKPSTREVDSMYDKALEIVLQEGKCSISRLQRRLGIGYNRAANIVEHMEEMKVVSAPINGKREVLIQKNQDSGANFI